MDLYILLSYWLSKRLETPITGMFIFQMHVRWQLSNEAINQEEVHPPLVVGFVQLL